MKYIKSIHEEFDRVVGFRYSEPKESYKVSIICVGQEINKDKIERALQNVSNLKFDADSINVTEVDEETIIESPDGPITIDAIIDFDVTIYTPREINGIVEELTELMNSAFDIQLLNFKYKKNINI